LGWRVTPGVVGRTHELHPHPRPASPQLLPAASIAPTSPSQHLPSRPAGQPGSWSALLVGACHALWLGGDCGVGCVRACAQINCTVPAQPAAPPCSHPRTLIWPLIWSWQAILQRLLERLTPKFKHSDAGANPAGNFAVKPVSAS